MPLPKKDKFLKEVLSCVKFPFDRDNIKSELDSHIVEKIDHYIAQGYDNETAEQLSINDMGDAKEIGTALNKQHNPILGYIWMLTNLVIIFIVIVNIYNVGLPLLFSLFSNSIDNIPTSNIVYAIDVNEKVKLDDTVIHFTNIVYEQNGDMNIFYKYYDTKLWGTGWSETDIGAITDNLGNIYDTGSGQSSGGIVTKSVITVGDFSSEADTLIISYDRYNRKYRLEIPLKAGDNNG